MSLANVSEIELSIQSYINSDIYEDGTVVKIDDDLLLDIGMDSLSLLMLIAFIEKEFELTISPALITIKNFRSVAVMSKFLVTLIDSQQ